MINYFKKILKFITKKEVYGVVITIIVAFFLYRIIAKILEKSINHGKDAYDKKKRRTITKLFQNATKYLILIIAALTILSIYGINITSMVAGLGITATIIGLALQDTFKDLINGVNIIMENYFIVGDYVEYNGFTGEVIEFGLKSTKIKNINGEVIIIANRNIMEIKNLSQENQTITIDIPLPYEEPIEKMEQIIEENILPQIDKLKDVEPNTVKYLGINELADSCIKYLISYKCDRETQWQARRDAHRIIITELKKHKISVPYPQLEVHNEK